MVKRATQDDLSRAMKFCYGMGVAHHLTVYALHLVSIGASFAAAALARDEQHSGELVATLAVIPGVATVLATTFKFDARSAWFFAKALRLSALHRLARAGAAATSDPEVAEKWVRIDEEMAKTRPGWGAFTKTDPQAEDK
jgi:hypothetical protein